MTLATMERKNRLALAGMILLSAITMIAMLTALTLYLIGVLR